MILLVFQAFLNFYIFETLECQYGKFTVSAKKILNLFLSTYRPLPPEGTVIEDKGGIRRDAHICRGIFFKKTPRNGLLSVN
jgi:hypothetical protein